jgi:hypothetical protein
LTSLLSSPDDSGGNSENQSKTPVAEETDSVPVPNLVGVFNAQGAAEALAAEGLVLGEVGEAPNDTIFAGVVSEQNPTAGKEVEPGTSVNVTVSTGPAQAALAPAPAPQPAAAPLPDPQPAAAPLPDPQPAAVQQPDPEAAAEAAEDREEAREDRQEARREAKEDQKGKGNNEGKS